MKTITIKQPWAHLICTPREDNPCLGIKDIENRTWPTKFRGRVLIHASAKPDYDIINTGNSDIYSVLEHHCFLFEDDIDAFCSVSAIIGSVEIVDCVQNHTSIWAEKSEPKYLTTEIGRELKVKPIYNWVLANPVHFDKPIENVKGKLSFWEYELPEEYLQEIERKLNHV